MLSCASEMPTMPLPEQSKKYFARLSTTPSFLSPSKSSLPVCRAATMRLALRGPTPGTRSSSDRDALFASTGKNSG
ncbi:MAG: hypothetical protein ABT01_06445 [Clostridium sp. SCN 57-10]|nr:MAG: hypothetical protein ABT01_06445 [Clostridium sp. SCN 57-10]